MSRPVTIDPATGHPEEVPMSDKPTDGPIMDEGLDRVWWSRRCADRQCLLEGCIHKVRAFARALLKQEGERLIAAINCAENKSTSDFGLTFGERDKIIRRIMGVDDGD